MPRSFGSSSRRIGFSLGIIFISTRLLFALRFSFFDAVCSFTDIGFVQMYSRSCTCIQHVDICICFVWNVIYFEHASLPLNRLYTNDITQANACLFKMIHSITININKSKDMDLSTRF